MAKKTRLGLTGYGVRRAGDFSGKTPGGGGGGHPVGKITRHGIGWGTRRNTSFAGRSSGTHPVGKITRLVVAWGSRRTGSFSGKTPGLPGGAVSVLMHDYRRRRV